MNHSIITVAAAMLDDIASGTLAQCDFYMLMEDAGPMSVDLCKLVLRERLRDTSPEYAQIMHAADCLKNICVGDNLRLASALYSCKWHSNNLFRIAETMKDGKFF